MPTLSSQFKQLFIADAAGTMQNYTPWLQSCVASIDNDDADVTTYASGGGRVTSTHIHGAISASCRAVFLYDTAMTRFLRQIVAARSGFRLYAISGSNAAPAAGDEVFQMSATLLAPSWSYQPGQDSAITCEFVPVDGGLYVPSWTIL